MSDGERAEGTLIVREAVGVFHDLPSFEEAIDELQSAGFDRSDISLLAAESTVARKLGHVYQKAAELEDDAAVPRAAYVGREMVAQGQAAVVGGLFYVGASVAVGAILASGGTLAAAILGAALAGGSGGLLGSVISRQLGRHHAQNIEQQLTKGGLLLWVRVNDDEHERPAVEILSHHSADDVHVHEIPVANEPARDPLAGWEVDPFLPGSRI